MFIFMEEDVGKALSELINARVKVETILRNSHDVRIVISDDCS